MAETRSAARPWLSAYPPGIPADLDIDRLGTLVDLFDDCMARSAPRPALESFGVQVSYAALGASAEAVAAWLAGQGLAKGDRVAIMMPNVAAYPATIFGVLLAGCTVVNVNPLYTPRELTAQLNDSGARVLFVLENFAHTVMQALPDLALDRIVLAGPGDGLGLAQALGVQVDVPLPLEPTLGVPVGLAMADEVDRVHGPHARRSPERSGRTIVLARTS